MTDDVTRAIESYIYYKKNKFAFITECCYTRDEVDENNPIKLLPNREYLRLYTKIYELCPLLAIPKTRRMTFSWTTIGLFCHDFIFKRVRSFAFVSKKEEDADEIVRRAEFMLDHIPEDKISRLFGLMPKYHYTFNYIDCPEMDSKIQGFPQGADQLRQFTFSGVFGDECAFWESAEAFYAATKPTIDGGGRMVLVSSVAPGFFKRLCFDALDMKGDINISEYTPNFEVPMQGVRLWMNPKNKFVVLEIHYTADPEKRDQSYKESIRSSLPLQQYLREYEIHWDTYSGHAVFPEFGEIHILNEEPKPAIGLPMLIAWDFGLTPACTVAQHEGNTTIFFKEFQAVNMGAERFVPMVVAQLRLMFPLHNDFRKNWKCWVDPSGFNRNDNDERQTAMTVAKAGFSPMPGPITWEGRRKAVADALSKLEKGKPTLQIYEKGCPISVKGFKGGYHYPEKNVDISPSQLRPVKNMSSHCFPEGTMVSTKDGDRKIEKILVGDFVKTIDGYRKVEATMNKENAETILLKFKSGRTLECTKDHPIWSNNNFLDADCLQCGDEVVIFDSCTKKENHKSFKALNITIKNQLDIFSLFLENTFTGLFGNSIMERFQKNIMFTILIKILGIIRLKTLSLLRLKNTLHIMAGKGLRKIQRNIERALEQYSLLRTLGEKLQKVALGIQNTLKILWIKGQCSIENVLNVAAIIKSKAEHSSAVFVVRTAKIEHELGLESITKQEHVNIVKNLLQSTNTLKFDTVVGKQATKKSKKVYDLTVSATHHFFANGVLVSNCQDTIQYICSGVKSIRVDQQGLSIPTPQYQRESNGSYR